MVEAEKNEFWDKDTGMVNAQVSENLKKRFPKKAKLAQNLYAKKEHLSYMIIDYPNANIIKCPICKCFITDRTKPKPIYTLKDAEELEGVMMCDSCAWQLDGDIKSGRSIESIIEEYK